MKVHLFFDTQLRFQTMLDLEYLRGDEGLDIIERVAIRRQHKIRMQLQAELDIDDALLGSSTTNHVTCGFC